VLRELDPELDAAEVLALQALTVDRLRVEVVSGAAKIIVAGQAPGSRR